MAPMVSMAGAKRTGKATINILAACKKGPLSVRFVSVKKNIQKKKKKKFCLVKVSYEVPN
jgi:hypothetical protein